jgi:fructose-specific phosphotransferase system IIC component
MKKLTNNQMSKTQGGFLGAFLVGLLVGYIIAIMMTGDQLSGHGGVI